MPPRGHAVVIGLDRVDPSAYAQWPGTLKGGKADALDMAKLARARGFTVSDLLDDRATRAAVQAAIREATERLVSGDMFLLTFAGHGIPIPNLNGDDLENLEDETWCLYDGLFLDDELCHALIGFAQGVRVIIVSDSCSSETVFHALARHVARGPAAAPGLDVVAVERWLQLSRIMPLERAQAMLEEHRAMYDAINEYLPPHDPSRVTASVLLLAACGDRGTAIEIDGHGVFTRALHKVWANGAFLGNYDDLIHEVGEEIQEFQHPKIGVLGPGTDLLRREHPFTV